MFNPSVIDCNYVDYPDGQMGNSYVLYTVIPMAKHSLFVLVNQPHVPNKGIYRLPMWKPTYVPAMFNIIAWEARNSYLNN